MIRRGILAALIALGGCLGGTNDPPEAAGPISLHRSPSFAVHVQVQVAPLGEVPNNGVQLPVAAGDGAHLAWLVRQGPPVGPDDLLAGHPDSGMRLEIRPLTPEGRPRVLCPDGASWPAFSADGRYLAWVIDEGDGPELALHDTRGGCTERKAVPFRRVIMPVPASDGASIAAIVEADGQPERCLAVIPWADGPPQLAPAAPGVGRLSPAWTDDGRIVYLETDGEGVYAGHWRPDRLGPERLVPLSIPPTEFDLFQAQVACGRPFSRDGRRVLYMSADLGGLVVVDLGSGRREALVDGATAACWFGDGFVAATADRLALHTDPDRPAALVVRGPWIPLDSAGDVLIALTEGPHRGVFGLRRIRVAVQR